MIEPLRIRVDRRVSAALAALDALPEDLKGSMGYDCAVNAVDTLEDCRSVARSLATEIREAEEAREGFDTWTAAERTQFIAAVRPLVRSLFELAAAVRAVLRAEMAEIQRLRAEAELPTP